MQDNYSLRKKELDDEWDEVCMLYGDSPEKLEFVKKALEEFPDDEDLLFKFFSTEKFYADALRSRGKKEEAMKYYKSCYDHAMAFTKRFPFHERATYYVCYCLKIFNSESHNE